MSTIPFTPIDGYLALPRLRPLSHVPAPFGRDWSLLPPGYSLRAELKALYAALLRTFCMSDQAIRSFCRWSPLEESHAATADVARPTAFEAPHGVAAQVTTETVTIPSVAGSVNRWTVLAGGACALGGAAVLAWIGVDHLTHRHTITHANFAGTVPTQRNSQPTTFRPPATEPAIADSAAGASALVAAPTPSHSGAAPAWTAASSHAEVLKSTTVSASVPASPLALPMAPPRVVVSQVAPPRGKSISEKAVSQRNQNQRHNARYADVKRKSHATAKTADASRFAIPKTIAHTSPRPSAAGPFSPLAPARLGVDEYAGVAISAATHLRDIPRAPRPATSNTPSATNGTEWMSHLSQRRVTEVPDQFAK
ncbi:MAG TPA: hypothetical protein VF534_23740 [Paraburkholderia sp.]